MPSPQSSTAATSEPEAVAAAADPNRLRAMVGQHFDFIWRSLRRLGVCDGDVDDVTQRVFLTVARRLDEIRPGAERSFLFATATREASHTRRSYKRRAEVDEEAIADKSTGQLRPDDLAGRRQALEFADTVLQAMDDDLRVVFVLFELEEMSSQEIAQLLDIPVGTAKSRLRRARADFNLRTAGLRAQADEQP